MINGFLLKIVFQRLSAISAWQMAISQQFEQFVFMMKISFELYFSFPTPSLSLALSLKFNFMSFTKTIVVNMNACEIAFMFVIKRWIDMCHGLLAAHYPLSTLLNFICGMFFIILLNYIFFSWLPLFYLFWLFHFFFFLGFRYAFLVANAVSRR